MTSEAEYRSYTITLPAEIEADGWITVRIEQHKDRRDDVVSVAAGKHKADDQVKWREVRHRSQQ
jgi:hypothetical protein